MSHTTFLVLLVAAVLGLMALLQAVGPKERWSEEDDRDYSPMGLL